MVLWSNACGIQPIVMSANIHKYWLFIANNWSKQLLQRPFKNIVQLFKYPWLWYSLKEGRGIQKIINENLRSDLNKHFILEKQDKSHVCNYRNWNQSIGNFLCYCITLPHKTYYNNNKKKTNDLTVTGGTKQIVL